MSASHTYNYRTIEAPATALHKVMGSRHLAYIYPVQNEDEIKLTIDRLWQQHHDATHICYAWRLGADKKKFRSSDDGEPPGTAGKPILSRIAAADLTDVLLCVVRYFGGTKLGTGGLVNAYATAAQMAIDASTIAERSVMELWQIEFDYAATDSVMRMLKQHHLKKTQMHSGTSCHLEFEAPLSVGPLLHQWLQSLTHQGYWVQIAKPEMYSQ